jgi:hypothetical protein
MTIGDITCTLKTNVLLHYSASLDRGVDTPAVNQNTSADSALQYTAGTVTRVYSERITITVASLTQDIDLKTLSDPIGNAFGFTSVYALYVRNVETATGGPRFSLGGYGVGAWTGPFGGSTSATVGPFGGKGELFFSAPNDGITVTAGSRYLRITHDGTGGESGLIMDLDIIIAGVGS